MPLCLVEYSLRIVYCISLGRLKKNTSVDVSEGGRKFNDPFDPYGSLSVLTLRRIQFMDRILHLIRETEKNLFDVSEGGRRLNDPFDLYGWLSAFTLRRV